MFRLFWNINNERGCFGGSTKPQAPPPTPAPAPVPTPEQTSPTAANDSRAEMLKRMRFGLVSTIKTSPRGITGTGPDLTAGGMYSGGKTKLGA